MTYNDELLKDLSEEERKEVLKILGEFSETGKSETYDNIRYQDYEEIPVDIETFLHHPDYLGKGLTNDEGKFTVFPYWEEVLKKIFPNNIDVAYHTVVLTGAIGLGKSFEADLIILYQLYKMLCLKDPYVYYGLQPIDKITFALINITLEASRGVAWDKIQQLLQASPWFMRHGTVKGTTNIEWQPPKGIELIPGSLPRHIIGRAVFSAFMDEVSFQPNNDLEKQIKKAKDLVNAADIRMQSRFMKGTYNPTILILASSKRTEQSYLETFIENKKKTESKTTLIIDEPQWVIRTDKDSDIKFNVAVGNKFLNNELIPLDATEDDIQSYRDRGYKILKVPIGYYEQFQDDIDMALTDIAGISTANSTTYISGERLSKVIQTNWKNAFIRDIIEVGNDPKDTSEYKDYFDLDRIESKYKRYPLYIHLDMSISGDKTGIAGTWIIGKKANDTGNKDLYYKVPFVVSIKAPKGYQVSFAKNRNFIRWLREQGFNVKGVSSDTFQSYDLQQQLKSEGFDCSIISVDRVENRICKPYQYFKSTIYEQRIELPKNNLLQDELLGLKRDGNGKIDHDASGINCFTGDTKIQLVDGRVLTMLELVKEYEEGKINYVYSINKAKQVIEPKPIEKAFCSGHNASLIEITLDNNEVITCTPEHRFMLRTGEYCEAKDLLENDSLMPLYVKYPSNGLSNYRMYYNPFENRWHYEHRSFASEILDKKYLVHHKDCNSKNNNPDNLIWCSRRAHEQIHAEMQTGAQSIEAKIKRSKSLKANFDATRDSFNYYTRWYKNVSPEEAKCLHQRKEDTKKAFKQKIEDLNAFFGIDYNSLTTREKRSYMSSYNNYLRGYDIFSDKITKRDEKRKACSQYFNIDYDDLNDHDKRSLSIKYAHIADPTYQSRVSQAVSNNHKSGKYIKAKQALQIANAKSAELKKLFPTLDSNLFKTMFGFDYDSLPKTKKAAWFNRYRQNLYELKNHKVKNIRYIERKEDVYDLTIKDNHNFALAAGIFVHNSKDAADAVCGSLYNASQNGDEFAYDFGDDVEATVDISSQTSNDGSLKKQITIDFENQLQQMFDPRVKDNLEEKPVEYTPQDFEKAKPAVTQPPDFVVQPKATKPVLLTHDMIIW